MTGHRVLAIVAGFLGAMVIIRPGVIPLNTGTLLVLLAAFLYSCAHVITKRLSDTESGNTVVFYMSLTILAYSALPAFLVWDTPRIGDLPAIIGLGITGYATHYCITRSLAEADATFAIAFDFMRLPFSVAFGWLLFREVLDYWTAFGALIIFAAGYYSTVRETGYQASRRTGHDGRRCSIAHRQDSARPRTSRASRTPVGLFQRNRHDQAGQVFEPG